MKYVISRNDELCILQGRYMRVLWAITCVAGLFFRRPTDHVVSATLAGKKT